MSLTVNHLIEIVLTPLNAIGLTPFQTQAIGLTPFQTPFQTPFHADFLIPVQEISIPPICDPPQLRSRLAR
jgi:hypothetical protein